MTQGSTGYHQYAATGEIYYLPAHDPSVAFPYQTYGAPLSSNWTIYSDGTIAYSNAGCV